jgi:hypothetical protein
MSKIKKLESRLDVVAGLSWEACKNRDFSMEALELMCEKLVLEYRLKKRTRKYFISQVSSSSGIAKLVFRTFADQYGVKL